MGEGASESSVAAGLARALARIGLPPPVDLTRLTGGATMESWRFSSGGSDYVLRRAPSKAFIEDRPFGHTTEAEIIRTAYAGDVSAPEVVAELVEEDGIGSGFIMRALPGTPDPREILAMDQPGRLLAQCAAELVRIHRLSPADVPPDVPLVDYRAAVARLREDFELAGGDRPILALGLKWLADNCPEPVEPVLNHGDFRLGNLLAQDGRLTGVLDWELAHFGDWHEDLAFGCMPVWRFGAYDRPALGLGSLEDYFSAYEANGGRPVDPTRLRFWTIYRTVWWALGCLRNARTWREGRDRMLERVVISRRTSEQELDLLLILEEDAGEGVNEHALSVRRSFPSDRGEANDGEMATAISEWLETVKHRMEGHDRFQLAVARNALGIIARDWAIGAVPTSRAMAADFLSGELDPLKDGDLLAALRLLALDKVAVDSPKYPSLAVARRKWTGED